MKRGSLYLVAGAMLATTALTSGAYAGTIGLVSTGATAYGGVAYPTAVIPLGTALNISAQSFSATAATANAVTSGTVDLFFRFNQQITTTFSANISITGAQFASSASTAQAVVFDSSAGTLSFSGSVVGTNICTSAIAGSDVILLSSCNGQNSLCHSVGSNVTANGLVVRGVSFTSMSGLATAGSSVALSAVITVNSSSFETTASANEITSRDNLTVTGTVGTPASIDVAASKGAFTALQTSVNSAVLGTIQISVNAALGANLSTTIIGANSIASGEVRVTTGLTADDAVKQFRLTSVAQATTVTHSVFSGGFVTFALTAANVSATDSYRVNVDFNGTKEIETVAAGTAAVAFTAITSASAASQNVKAPPGASGLAIAGLSRNGFTIDLNGVYGGGFPVQYTSVIRIANTGAIAGAPTVAIYDEATGSLLGTASALATIAGGASKQYLMSELETAAGLTASTNTYRLTVTGGLTGYVQQLLWNQTGGFFTDLSGRRTSKTGNN